MNSADSHSLIERKFAFSLSLIVAVIAALVTIGWALDLAALKDPLSGAGGMKPNTALGMLLGAVGLATLSVTGHVAGLRLLAALLACACLTIGAVSLGEALFDWSPVVERWLFDVGPGVADPMHPGRVTPPASFCLVLIGAAVFIASRSFASLMRMSTICALSIALILVGGLALLGHLAQQAFGTNFWTYTGLSKHTSAGALALGCALLAWVIEGRELTWRLDSKTTMGFAIGVLAILAASAETYIFTTQLRQDAKAVSHSQEVLREIEELTASQHDLTISLGRYLITNDASALATRDSIKAAIEEDAEHIRRLTEGNPQQQDRIGELVRLTAVRVNLSDRIIAIQQSSSPRGIGLPQKAPGTGMAGVPEPSPLGDEYPAVGEAVESLLNQMRAYESSLLQQHETSADASSTRTFLLLPVGTYLSASVLLLGLFFLNARAIHQKLAVDSHSELETYFRTIFEVTPDGIILADADRAIVMANPAAGRMFGYPVGEMTGMQLQSLLPGTVQADVAHEPVALLENASAKSVGSVWRTEGNRSDGSVFPVELVRSALTTAHGVFVLGVARDLTESTRHEARFRQIVEAAPNALVMASHEGEIKLVNAQTERMFGYQRRELLGQKVGILVPARARDLLSAWSAAYIAQPDSREMGRGRELLGCTKDGREFPIEVGLSPIETGEGAFALASIIDISERKMVAEARSRLAAIVESSDDAIIGKDLSGTVSSWNRGAERIFGFSAKEMIGQSILRIVPEERLSEEPEILARVTRGESIEHSETIRRTKDGRLIDVSISVSPIFDVAGKVIGASKIARDITSGKHLEAQLRQSQKMEAIGQLTGGVAHDFNNLLGVILGNLDLIERAVANNEALAKRVQNAQKAALRGADLTRRMLAFSSRQPLHAAPTLLVESVQNMIEMASRTIGPEIRITSSLDQSIPPILVDASGLENALLNLVVNARDAMPDGGSIVISAVVREVERVFPPAGAEDLSPGHYLCLSVSDTGVGMSFETLARAFEPFFTTKARGKGTGLGMAMVYGFAKQSGGTARVYSELGEGTTVTLYLPLADGVATPRPAAVVPDQAQAGAGRLVLVVDDEVDLLEIAVAYLEDMGYRVLHAADGLSALALVTPETELELLITDVIMPGGINGVELARRMRAQRPGLKIIYSSGFPSDALAQKSGTRIDAPLLYKPYQRSAFVAAVSRVMDAKAPESDGSAEAPASDEKAIR